MRVPDPADDRIQRHRAEVAGVGGVVAVVAEDGDRAVGDDDIAGLAALAPCRLVGVVLGQILAVDHHGPVSELHPLAREADHPLHEWPALSVAGIERDHVPPAGWQGGVGRRGDQHPLLREERRCHGRAMDPKPVDDEPRPVVVDRHRADRSQGVLASTVEPAVSPTGVSAGVTASCPPVGVGAEARSTGSAARTKARRLAASIRRSG